MFLFFPLLLLIKIRVPEKRWCNNRGECYRMAIELLYSMSKKKGYPLKSSVSAERSNLNASTPK